MRRVAAALAGAVLSTGILLTFSYMVFVFLSAFGVVPLMIVIAFGRSRPRIFVRQILLSWLAIVILNGITTVFYEWTGVQSLTFYIGFAVLLIAGMLVRTLLYSLQKQEQQMQVLLCHDGKRVDCVGLYDSGNRLQMPDSGEPVHIISRKLLLQVHANMEEAQTIPFRALGTEEGSIKVVQIEEMLVKAQGKSCCFRHAWMGCAGDALLVNTEYQVILNSAVRIS